MWFKNALIFNYTVSDKLDLASNLEAELLKPCPPHARFVYGWLPVIADLFAHEVSSEALICLGKEERILPRGVIKKFLDERVLALETQYGRAFKRTEKTQMLEEIEFELLPKAFCIQKRMYALFDTKNQRLIVNSSSVNQANQLLSLLRKSIPGIQIEPMVASKNLAMQFVEWINQPSSLSSSFQLAANCKLFSLDNEKKNFICKGYDLPATEILSLIEQGLAVSEISLIWKERIAFTLTQNLTLKNIKCLDYLTEEFAEVSKLEDEFQQQDGSLCLLGEELRQLISDLEKELSIEKESLAA